MFADLVRAARLLATESKLPEGARVCEYVEGVGLVALGISESFNKRERFREHAVVVRAKVKGSGKYAGLPGAVMMSDEAKAHTCLSLAAIADNGRVNVLE